MILRLGSNSGDPHLGDVDVVYLDVRYRRLEAAAPVDQPVVAIDAARLEHAHERLQHGALRRGTALQKRKKSPKTNTVTT